MEMKNDLASHLWWFHNRKNANTKRSSWLQTTISNLDEKTQTMLQLIEEEDADSFAKRAEMYYKKRPQLINMVEDFHRAHKSLAERYDQIKYRPDQKSISSPDSISEIYELEDQSEESSEVSDPDQEGEGQTQKDQEKQEEEEASLSIVSNEELMKLKEEIEKLKEENKNQKEELMEKDEAKREVIRQLSLSLDSIREDNVMLRESVEREPLQNQDIFLTKIFKVSPKSRPRIFGLF